MFRTSIDNPLRAAATAAILAICLVLGGCSERMNREDFVTLLKGKTEQEVLKIEGRPTTVDDKSPDRHVWTYTSRTFDVSNQNKMDARTIVIFSRSAEGKMVVTQVQFE
jgi:outer membrane protein assembly factor BamE (lipoprotein component of BamABCDE complex)